MNITKPGRKVWRNTRPRTGQLMAEQLASMFLLVPVITLLLGLIDASLVIVGSTVNEGVARDAARIAAVGPASEYENRVAGYLSGRQKEFSEGIMRNLQLDKDHSGIDIVPPKNLGTISVTTSMDIYPLFVLGSVLQASKQVPYMRVTSQHTFPLTEPRSSK